MVIKGQRSREKEGEESLSLLSEAGHVHPRSTFLARNVAAKPRQYACLCQGRGDDVQARGWQSRWLLRSRLDGVVLGRVWERG